MRSYTSSAESLAPVRAIQWPCAGRSAQKKTTQDYPTWSLSPQHHASESSDRPLAAIAPDIGPVDSFRVSRDRPRGEMHRHRNSTTQELLSQP